MRSLLVLVMFGLAGNLLAQSGPELKDVKTIYVDRFGSDEGADVIRSKVITELVKTGKVRVVADRAQADAILTAGATIAARNSTAGVQLVDRENRIIWADNVSSLASLRKGSSSNLAEDIVGKLVKAIEKAKKK